VKSTVCVALTALDNVKMIVVPVIEIAVIDRLAPLTSTAKEVASTPAPSIVSSMLRVNSVGEDVLTLPPVKPGA
jgi:hypothetical protein